MRLARSVVVCASLSLAGGLTGAVPSGAPGIPAAPPSSIASVPSDLQAGGDSVLREIARLGDDSFKVREQATSKLWNMGSSVIPQLREAVKSPEPEIAKRASVVLRKLELEISPDTPAEIQELVDRYNRTPSEGRVAVMFELRQQRAWRQILKLHELEKDPEIRAKIRSAVDGVAVMAARESLVAAKTAEARGYLEMAPDDATGLLALAEFHRSHGTLKTELAKKSTNPQWTLAMQRVAGEFADGRVLASAQGEVALASTFAMLEGDPLPWIQNSQSAAGLTVLHNIYQSLAEKNWRGQAITEEDLEPLEPYARGTDDGSRRMACSIYFLMGQASQGEASFVKLSPIDAFRHFDLLERMPDAYRAVGLDPVKPDFASWIGKRFLVVLEQGDNLDEKQTDLVVMASFLERRGLVDELKAYDAPLANLAAGDSDAFLQMLRYFFGNSESGTGAVSLAKRATAAYATDDDLKWGDVVDHVFGDSDDVKQWWNWLAVLDPGASRAARLEGMLALFHFGQDPGHLRDKWLNRAWKAVDAMPKEEAAGKLPLMVFLASASQDLTTGLRAWDRLELGGGEDMEGYGNYLAYLSAVGRWEKASELWLKLSEKAPVRAELHAYAAASLRRAGKAALAAEHDGWADKLALADPITCVRVGQGYAYGGDYGRASQWWERAFVVSQPGTKTWQDTLSLFALDRLQEGDWKRAAALHEVIAEIHSGAESSAENPGLKLRMRANADLARAMVLLPTDREKAIATLKRVHGLLLADGSLADYFFPAVRKAGLTELHDAWFEESWSALQAVLKAYPGCENTQNTTAWLASRAVRRLDEAEALVDKALAASPGQAAYLDTKAEIYFARRDRKRAIEFSTQSLASDPVDDQLRRQFERYRSASFPTP